MIIHDHNPHIKVLRYGGAHAPEIEVELRAYKLAVDVNFTITESTASQMVGVVSAIHKYIDGLGCDPYFDIMGDPVDKDSALACVSIELEKFFPNGVPVEKEIADQIKRLDFVFNPIKLTRVEG